jgi:naphthalene 1,2-dioxygenase system ferredoxin subunit
MSEGKWIRVAAVGAVPEGEVVGAVAEGRRIAVYNVGGTFFATDDLCTHGSALLSDGWLDGDEIECPLHAGRFDVKTGKAICAPVTRDVATYPVRAEGDDLEVRLGD